jgi:Fur family zinc uptake transcriptional regulator
MLEEIVRKMSEHGWRVTDQRRTLATIFLESAHYLTPREVYEEMCKTYRGLSFDTVYRNLRLMADIGIIEQISLDDTIKFKLHCAEHDHHHHLICVNCEQTFSFVFCPMDFARDFPNGFQVLSHKFEVYGRCQQCSQEEHAR